MLRIRVEEFILVNRLSKIPAYSNLRLFYLMNIISIRASNKTNVSHHATVILNYTLRYYVLSFITNPYKSITLFNFPLKVISLSLPLSTFHLLTTIHPPSLENRSKQSTLPWNVKKNNDPFFIVLADKLDNLIFLGRLSLYLYHFSVYIYQQKSISFAWKFAGGELYETT